MHNISVIEKKRNLSPKDQDRAARNQEFGKLPDPPSCFTCPNRKSRLGYYHGSNYQATLVACYWGGPLRFVIDKPASRLCKRHPDYGKPYPAPEVEKKNV